MRTQPVSNPSDVVHFHRQRGLGFSIENIFQTVREHAGEGVAIRTHWAPRAGASPRTVLANGRAAMRDKGGINHVVGDTYYLACFLRPATTIVTYHDCVALRWLHGARRLYFSLLWYWLPLRRARIITAVSTASKDELVARFGADPAKVRVVPNCIQDAFQPCPRPFREECPVVLQIGTTDNKNIERLAEALAHTPCQLRIIGQLRESQRLALDRAGIRYSSAAGLSPDQIRDEYRDCDIVAFASTYEGFGLPIIEAQAVGRPVLTSALSPMDEVAGGAAVLVDPLRTDSIRAGVDRLRHDCGYRCELVRRGFGNVTRFRAAKVAAEYLALYRSIQSPPGASHRR